MTDQDICNQLTNSNVGETSPAVDLPNGGEKSVVIDDSQLVGVPVIVAGDAVAADQAVVLPVEVKTDVKRKRGRPPRGQAKQPPVKKQKDDEDVCFICFDGGSLVICDRRGCPKAYHPACIKRDEAFFKSKSKWNCGWHICSVCQKSAHYMCYTCPFSLCKGCTRDSSYLCVRGDKGFCNTCMKVIMLIENKEQINKEVAQVDFDDARNWEYLFKIYWISLKEELSLTSKELAEAKNPWKESGSVTSKKQPYKVLGSTNNLNSAVFDISSGHLKVDDSLRQNCSESTQGCTKWATEKLLDFVAYMKNGDTSVLSQFDVQVLVLDYIKQKNLHDPCDRSYVVCDTKLESLFGKSRVEHSEMPKLLNFHFLLKEESTNDASAGGRVQVDTVKVSSDQSNNNLTSKDEKHKPSKSAQYAVQTSLNDYAAVNVPNMNLIYLRRNLVENLTQVKDKFHEMVVGSFVRIRVSGDEHKQDMYRLVQVVGTTKVSVPYKISNATTDMMLEILNLDKKEVLSIDAISNQEFSEDECRHLRQSIKCGIVKRFTVGEIQKKAMQLRGVRLHDNLGAEISRLNHLREEANRSALEKEVRECVEKIQLLKAPAEIHRRLSQIPEVISDPDMDPNYQSEEDAGEHGHHVKPCNPEYNTEGNEQVALRKRGDASGDNSSSQCNSSSPQCEQSRNVCATSYPDKEENAAKALQRLSEEKYACRSNSLERVGWNSQAVTSSTTVSTVLSEASSAPSIMGNPLSAYSGETKLWHYRGPNGSIQGPFSVVELLKWSTTGVFPLDMKIWANGKQDDPVLLSDVLNGLFHKALPGQNDSISQLREVGVTSDSKLCNSNFVYSESSNAREDGRQIEGKWHGSIAQVNSRSKNEIVGSGRLVTQPSAWTAPIVSYNKDITSGIASQSQDSFKGTNICYQPLQAHSSLSSTTHTVKDYASHPHELNPKVESRNLNSDHEISLSRGISIRDNTGHIQMNHCHSQGYAGQTSGRNLGHPPVNFSPHNLDLNSAFCPTKSTDSPDQNGDAIMNVNSPPLKTSNKDWESETIENKEPVSSGGHFHNPSFRYQPNSPVKVNNSYQKGLVAEKKQSVSLNISVQDSGPSWSSTSSIMVGRSQLPHINDGWGGYNSAPAKHSGVWDPNHISVSTSSLHDHTATSRSSDFSQFSLSNPVSNLTSWHMSGSEPIEFSTLAEESVSDLLAEVDAMESQCGMGSPTSMMNSGEDLINLNLEMA